MTRNSTKILQSVGGSRGGEERGSLLALEVADEGNLFLFFISSKDEYYTLQNEVCSTKSDDKCLKCDDGECNSTMLLVVIVLIWERISILA